MQRDTKRKMNDERIKELQKQIADLKSRWRAHSVPPAMVQQLYEIVNYGRL